MRSTYCTYDGRRAGFMHGAVPVLYEYDADDGRRAAQCSARKHPCPAVVERVPSPAATRIEFCPVCDGRRRLLEGGGALLCHFFGCERVDACEEVGSRR